MHILIIETSTTSAKAMLYDTNFGIVKIETENYKKEYNDTGEQDGEGVFLQTMNLAKKVSEGRKIDIIALSNTWHSVMLCDKKMRPVTRVHTWASSLAKNVSEKMRKDKNLLENVYQKTGCILNASYPLTKIIAMRENGINIEKHNIVCQGSYNYYKLTGKNIISRPMASGSALLNIYTKEYDKEMLDLCGVKEEHLPKLAEYNHTEMLTKEMANMLGIAACPVIVANPDGMLNQVGENALPEKIMTFSVGTSAAVRLSASSPKLHDPSIWCYLSPTAYIIGAATSGACNCVDWFKNSMFDKESTYKDLETDVTFKKDRPIFMPFLFGERNPGFAKNTGSFFDLKPSHDRQDLYISVLEGVLFNIYQCYGVIKNIYGSPNEIKLSGGILNSKLWTQMCADIFGQNMKASSIKQTSVMGAAVIAMEKLGVIKNLCEKEYGESKRIYPDMDMHKKYSALFERYLYWYEKTK